MGILPDKDHCSGCTACQHVCPVNCISMVADEQGFAYPRIDEAACIDCGLCSDVCPLVSSPSAAGESPGEPDVYAVKHKDASVRAASSSGGVFTAISDSVLERGGVVYGAAFDAHFRLRHVRGETRRQRDTLRGSKYVQSELGDVFLEVKSDLDRNKPVLFSGTPCQIAGLYAYLRDVPEHLIGCDLVCHGVPSPRIFAEYLQYVEHKRGGRVTAIDFRDKSSGWRRFSVTITSTGGAGKAVPALDDPYFYLFSRSVTLRPACYNCRFATFARVSDITLGDFWGSRLRRRRPDFVDDQGVSLVLVNTAKGKKVFDSVRNRVAFEASNRMECEQMNLIRPSPPSPRRERFWTDYRRKGFDYVAFKYTRHNPVNRVKETILEWIGDTKCSLYLRRMEQLLAGR